MKLNLTSFSTMIFLSIFSFSNLMAPLAANAFVFNPNQIITDEQLTASFSMSLGEIQSFLEKGYLANYVTTDIDGKRRHASEIIWRAGQRNGVSPKVILVMLQKEQSLITDDAPSASQLDWAMGYAVCDDCNHRTESIQRFKGFAKQINSATLQLTDGYLTDLQTIGYTVRGLAAGEATRIDGQIVVPANNATVALYTYTPHLHGNSNFAKLYQGWFTNDYPSGTLLQDTSTGAVWLIQRGVRRPITSRTALLSRYSDPNLIPTTTQKIESYPAGNAISLPNYSLVKTPTGDIYLLVDDSLRHITSMEAFRQIGFNLDELIEIETQELDAYSFGMPITEETLYPQGTLLQHSATGSVYYIQDGNKHPISSREILQVRFGDGSLMQASTLELMEYKTGTPVLFPDGTLIKSDSGSAVYVVSDGKRRPIESGEIFEDYGWQWEKVIITTQKAIESHPLGESITTSIATQVETEIASN